MLRAGSRIALAAALGVASAAQDPAAVVQFRAPDGSRILLLPVEGAPIVHWTTFAPAGATEDPAGGIGLAVAVARASLWGAVPTPQVDAARAAWRSYEQLDAQLQQAGTEAPEELFERWRNALEQALTTADPFAWQQELRSAPAIGPELEVVHDGTLLQLTVPTNALERVVSLLAQRRSGALLVGWRRQLEIARLERQRDRGARPFGGIVDELLEIGLAGHPATREEPELLAAPSVDAGDALAVFARTQSGPRTLHVLVGSFDPATVRALLERELTPLPDSGDLAPSRVTPTPRGERRSSLHGATSALVAGWLPPPGISAHALELLAEWLAGGEDAFLPQRLRARGLPTISVRAAARFPGPQPPYLFGIEIADRGVPPAASETLLAALDAVLAEALETGPSAVERDLVVARHAARQVPERAGSRELSRLLAIECGAGGREPQDVLSPPALDAAALHAAARALLVRERRTVVLQEPAR